SAVLFFYDFFLTLPTEFRLIWSRRLTGSSILFILSRYNFLLLIHLQIPSFESYQSYPSLSPSNAHLQHVPFPFLILPALASPLMLNQMLDTNTWSTASTVINSFLTSLENILINRFVLNLRAFSNRTIQHSVKAPSNTTAPPLSVLDFAENRFLGNIGAPLDYNQWDDVDELEDEVEQGDENIELEIPDNTVNPLTTLVPVVSSGVISLFNLLVDDFRCSRSMITSKEVQLALCLCRGKWVIVEYFSVTKSLVSGGASSEGNSTARQ
ncbi:hypothetical protein BDP27DRAFT_1207250, partial [Rhodocollybia butyracea]